MSFAKKYIEASHYLGHQIDIDYQSDFVIVIPAFNEPLIFETIDALRVAEHETPILLIVVVNYSIVVSEITKEYNQILYRMLKQYAQEVNNSRFSVLPIWFPDMPRKHAGAGLARKVGMDMAISLFAQNNNSNGIIASLDADCYIDSNYYQVITEHFNQHPKSDVATINFRHQRDGLSHDHKFAIDQYELYLRYFVLACRWAGFPFAFQTIGSCFAVRAVGYVKNGGMSKKHAGEDFYFLQKMFPNGNNRALFDTRVYPSSRLSRRVPFGTGPALCEITEQKALYEVYAFASLNDLKSFYQNLQLLYDETQSVDGIVPLALQDYFEQADFAVKFAEARNNSASPEMFEKRMLNHFNAFQLVKYLNFAHENNYYQKGEVMYEMQNLCKVMGVDVELSGIDEMLTLAENLERI